ncbi:MAG: ectoine hydrolase DoeA [Gammaproteobacteria bacterium]|nr:ectoine hydrolase DoeA [Gammaproteobacteria bacterium]MDH3468485.1 ectoine hydrolase DoeA [Gammaproteobacteria bacterium]
MTEIELRFSRDEYGLRLDKTRAAMQAAGIELLIVSDPSNMAWLSGYDGWSFYVHQCVLLTLDGDPIWYGRGQDANGAKRTVFMDHDHIIGYPDHYVQSTQRHPMDFLSRIIQQRRWERLAIGVEMDNYYFSAACYASLQSHLPQAMFKDATGLVNWQRAVKSPQEIEYMRIAARMVEQMHAHIFDRIEPGLRKNEMAAEIFHRGILGVDGYGGDYPAIVPLLPTGADASAPHLTWNDKPFERGTGTFFEIAGCYHRYHCPQSRTIYLGKPPQKWLDAEQAMLEGIAAALNTAKPGATCEHVEDAWRKAIARHGIEKESRCGYSIGLSYPPDWGERTMSLRPGDHSVLQENMTFHFIPALWFDDWGLEITESFVVTANGAETFCNTPRKLLVKT